RPLGRDALDLEQARDGLRGLRALTEPVLHLRLVELDRRGLGLRVVATDDLEEPAVTRRARVGRDDAVDRVLLGAHPREPELDCHRPDRLAAMLRGRPAKPAGLLTAATSAAFALALALGLLRARVARLAGRARHPRHPAA